MKTNREYRASGSNITKVQILKSGFCVDGMPAGRLMSGYRLSKTLPVFLGTNRSGTLPPAVNGFNFALEQGLGLTGHRHDVRYGAKSWRPDSRGSLFYKFVSGLPIAKSDIDQVLSCDEEAHCDPRMLGILIASHLGKLPKKRCRPKPKNSFKYIGQVLIAEDVVKERAEQIRKDRKNMNAIEQRALLSPMQQAAEEIATEFKPVISGRSLTNAISSQKRDPLFGE